MVKNPPAKEKKRIHLRCGRQGSIPGLGRSPGGRAQQPTPVFLPAECHGQRSLEGYGPQGHKESDTIDRLSPALEGGMLRCSIRQDVKSLRPKCVWASLVAQLVKNPPEVQETWVRFLGWEDPLEKGKATHTSLLAQRIPWRVHGVAKSRTRLTDFHFHFQGVCILFTVMI